MDISVGAHLHHYLTMAMAGTCMRFVSDCTSTSMDSDLSLSWRAEPEAHLAHVLEIVQVRLRFRAVAGLVQDLCVDRWDGK